MHKGQCEGLRVGLGPDQHILMSLHIGTCSVAVVPVLSTFGSSNAGGQGSAKATSSSGLLRMKLMNCRNCLLPCSYVSEPCICVCARLMWAACRWCAPFGHCARWPHCGSAKYDKRVDLSPLT